MKTLTLVRHAKSSWDDSDLPDHERPLNARGERDIPVMGQRLKALGYHCDAMYSSTAARARATATGLAGEIDYDPGRIDYVDAIYEATRPALSGLIQELPDQYEHVMLVGHNPGFSEAANWLLTESIGSLPTCGIVCISLHASHWRDAGRGAGERVFFDYPKRLA